MTMTLREDDLERYLDGDLPPAERTAVERALAADPALRAELQLRRELGSLLRQDEERALLEQLEAIGERITDEPERGGNAGRRKWWLLLALLAVAGALFYYLLPPTAPVPPSSLPAPSQEREIAPDPIEETPELPLPDPQIDPSPDDKNQPITPAPSRPIADYTPNAELEAAVVRLRGAPYTLDLDPVPTTLSVRPVKESASVILKGRIAKGDTQPNLVVHLLTNRVEDYYTANYLATIPVRWDDDSVEFRVNLPVPTQRGRYYWVIEDVGEEAIIRVGAFDVQ